MISSLELFLLDSRIWLRSLSLVDLWLIFIYVLLILMETCDDLKSVLLRMKAEAN